MMILAIWLDLQCIHSTKLIRVFNTSTRIGQCLSKRTAQRRNTRFCSETSVRNCSISKSTHPLYTVTVWGTGSSEISPCVCVKSNDKTYLFNCGSGTFRGIARLSKAPVVCFTGSSWERIGGVVELFLSVYGPSHDKRIKCLMPSRGKNMCANLLPRVTGRHTWDIHEDISHYQDNNFIISGIEIDLPGSNEGVIVYSCKHTRFCSPLEEGSAIQLDANHVTLAKKELAHSFKAESFRKNGSTFVVVDCLDNMIANTICTHARLQPKWFIDNDESVDLIIHITPLEVLQCEQYCKWMSSFGTDVHHLLLHSSICPGEVAWRDAMCFSLPFHLMNPSVYHFPHVPEQSSIDFAELNMRDHIEKNHAIIGCTGLRFSADANSCLSIDTSGVLEPLESWFTGVFEKAWDYCGSYIKNYHRYVGIDTTTAPRDLLYGKKPALSLKNSNDVIVTFLGTQARTSSTLRNSTGILVQTLHDGNVLLDCGESTLMQLYKCFGYESVMKILSEIHTVFISHWHPDHFLGIFDILSAISTHNGNTPINVVAPIDSEVYLRAYYSQSNQLDINFLDSSVTSEFPLEHGNLCLKTVPVKHMGECYGVKLNQVNGWNLVYSGDTCPYYKLVDEGRNADLLIHEATYNKSIVQHNIRSKHTSYTDCVEISKAMNASFTVFTHFGDTLFPLRMKQVVEGVVPAVDLMSIRLSDIKSHCLDSMYSLKVNLAIARFMLHVLWDDKHR